MEDEHPLQTVDRVAEFNAINDFMQDEQVDKALELVVKLITKPEIAAAKAPKVIVLLEALAAKFAILAMYYTQYEKGKAGSEESKRKSTYYTVEEAMHSLSAAVKYSAKYGDV